jgi:hypothetical protein
MRFRAMENQSIVIDAINFNKRNIGAANCTRVFQPYFRTRAKLLPAEGEGRGGRMKVPSRNDYAASIPPSAI